MEPLKSLITTILEKGDDTVDSFQAIAPEVLEGIYAYAYRYYQLENFSEALPLFLLLCSQDRENSSYWLALGGCYQRLKEYEKAVEAYSFSALYDWEGNNPYPHYYAVECFLSLSDIPKALEAMKAAFAVCGQREDFKVLRNRLRYLHKCWKQHLKKEE